MKLKVLFKLTLTILSLLVIGQGSSTAQTLADYTSFPSFLGVAVKPNILLILDNSSSMLNCAYKDADDDDCEGLSSPSVEYVYDTSNYYLGYFNHLACYNYTSSKFIETSGTSGSCSDSWDGNFLNWITMRRIDITKWVMIGGECAAARSSDNSCTTLTGQSNFTSALCCTTYYKKFNLNGLAPSTYTDTRCIRVATGNFVVQSGSSCEDSGGDTFKIKVDRITKMTGIIQEVGDSARIALMIFDGSNGGDITSNFGATDVSLINSINNMNAPSWTPLAESLYEAARFFAQIPPAFDSGHYSVGGQYDPFCFTELTPIEGETGCKTSTQGRWVECCKSFVLIFTDGNPTQDLGIPSGLQDYADTAGSHTSDHHDPCSAQYGGPSDLSCLYDGSHYLDDIAYWAHTTDLRPETGGITGIGDTPNPKGFPGIQSLDIYTVFAFGTGSQLIKDAAKMGGFKDTNGNNLPDLQSEWDEDGDGNPDHYYEATNADTLKEKLMEAIIDILQESASGTSISVLATNSGGEGAIYQSFFYPSINEGKGNGEVKWVGNTYALFVDSFGNMREDTDGDGELILNKDMIVRTFYDTTLKTTTLQRFADADGDGSADSTTPTEKDIPLNAAKTIWNGGERLALTNSINRTIFTWLNLNHDGVVDTGEFRQFTDADAATLKPYLRATDDNGSGSANDEAVDIINFIRGDEIPGMRKRKLTVNGTEKVWKLGDIVYSTPTVVAAPRERYDLIYGDSTYQTYYNQFKNRRQVLYVGANDGMLHAFNAGIYTAGDGKTTHGKFEKGPAKGGTTYELGDELWAFIPYELLPHLKWLTMESYTHVYYVDLTPKVTDVKLWAETGDADHPGGWGTILIGGMRFGGKPITVTDTDFTGPTTRTFMSAYFALDITNPEKDPVFLGSFTDTELGLTTSFPTIIRSSADPNNPSATVNWFMMVGTGPTDYDATSTQNGRIKILDLKTMQLVKTIDTGQTNSFMGDPINVDGNLDYSSDVAYIGNSFYANTVWKGDMFRLNIQNVTNPENANNWILSTLFTRGAGKNPGPITAAPSAALGINSDMWVYFGTGRYLTTEDESDETQQRFYGIKDACWQAVCTTTVTQGDLLHTTGISVKTDGTTSGGPQGTFDALLTDLRNSTSNKGWYFELDSKERVLAKSTILGGIVFFTSFIPDGDICAAGGISYIYALYYETGTSYKESSFEDLVPSGDPVVIENRKALGEGLPSAIAIHIGTADGDSGGTCKGGVKGFIQQSTGMITEICGDTALSIRSGIKGWRDF